MIHSKVALTGVTKNRYFSTKAIEIDAKPAEKPCLMAEKAIGLTEIRRFQAEKWPKSSKKSASNFRFFAQKQTFGRLHPQLCYFDKAASKVGLFNSQDISENAKNRQKLDEKKPLLITILADAQGETGPFSSHTAA